MVALRAVALVVLGVLLAGAASAQVPVRFREFWPGLSTVDGKHRWVGRWSATNGSVAAGSYFQMTSGSELSTTDASVFTLAASVLTVNQTMNAKVSLACGLSNGGQNVVSTLGISVDAAAPVTGAKNVMRSMSTFQFDTGTVQTVLPTLTAAQTLRPAILHTVGGTIARTWDCVLDVEELL